MLTWPTHTWTPVSPLTAGVDLATVAGLQKGRSEAPEPGGIGPVDAGRVAKTIPYLLPTVAAIVRVQLLTGCRPNEVMTMTTAEITLEGKAGTYTPTRHKTAWRGKSRVIALGPQAVTILRSYLKPEEPDAFLFAPDLGTTRSARTPRYNRRTYRQAIVRACRRADLTSWTPLQLRHTCATAIRERFGLEAAQVILGHAKPDTTLIHAERSEKQARAIMAKFG